MKATLKHVTIGIVLACVCYAGFKVVLRDAWFTPGNTTTFGAPGSGAPEMNNETFTTMVSAALSILFSFLTMYYRTLTPDRKGMVDSFLDILADKIIKRQKLPRTDTDTDLEPRPIPPSTDADRLTKLEAGQRRIEEALAHLAEKV
jgi:hypothetical protein